MANMKDILPRLNGSSFESDSKGKGKDIHVQGQNGEYTCSTGTVYKGAFYEGTFDGEGTLYFPSGGRYVGVWKLGRLMKGTYFFDDNLEYSEENWKYCSQSDRRFWTEVQHGIRLSEQPQLTDKEPSPVLAASTYDVGDGIYDPSDNKIHSYDHRVTLRVPTQNEIEWANTRCRVGLLPSSSISSSAVVSNSSSSSSSSSNSS
eukprot:TRINITY_DN453_c0_g1_i1.p1 TRINITY_DN453_c0_g1~~TRINITY_DN453_c0_g1_i1.p1  ORF type:complete len:203 (+),score=67.13 TRINITY_DN453_c0_g1_i1:215-823(+)